MRLRCGCRRGVPELRRFAVLSIDLVAQALAVSPATVEVDWRIVRALLSKRVGDAG